MSTITIQAIGVDFANVFSYKTEYIEGANVQTYLQNVYNNAQTSAKPDPFTFTLEYFGYSQDPTYPGYLGYELLSIDSLDSGQNKYWLLYVDSKESPTGLDTTIPEPNSNVEFRYFSLAVASTSESDRTKVIKAIRTRRK